MSSSLHPQVAIITPTWQRHNRLMHRCIPSVQAQKYVKGIVHVIVSDGPDPELGLRLRDGAPFTHQVVFVQLPEHDPQRHWGHHARLAGIEAAASAYIGYVDDDDALRPEHCRLLAGALDEDPSIGWAYSSMASYSADGVPVEIGAGAPACGHLGTPMIMHRREILAHGTWGPASPLEDWELAQRWMNAGVTYGHVREVTVDVWPSINHSHS